MKPSVSARELFLVIEQVRSIPVIVEGKRDVISLEKLGFTRIHEINRPIFEVCEKFESGQVVQILTDLDSAGKKLYSQLKQGLDRCGVRVDPRLRDALFNSEVSHIEGLARYILRH